jgi:hypothetical protein
MFFISFVGLAIAHIQRQSRGVFCHQCGTALGRDHTARNLTFGWWSIYGILLTLIALLINITGRVKARTLAQPHGHLAPPLATGRPALLRLGPWIAFLIIGGLVAFVVTRAA